MAECVTDVRTTFWRLLWPITEQTHGNMESTCFYKKERKRNVNGIIYASVLQLIIRENQSKCENNSTYYVIWLFEDRLTSLNAYAPKHTEDIITLF